MPYPVAMRSRVSLALALMLCVGFEWPGRVARLQQALERGTPIERRDAARRLLQEPAQDALPVILRALEDDDREVRQTAAGLAAELRAGAAVPILLEWQRDAQPQTRAIALETLGRIADPRALPALMHGLADPSPEVRVAAVSAVAAVAAGSIDVLAPRVHDADARVRLSAVHALAGLHDARALPPLVRASADPMPEVRAAALAALGRSPDARALPALAQALRARDEDVALTAAAALGTRGRADAVGSLLSVLDEAPSRLAEASVAALGVIDSDVARAALVKSLGKPKLAEAATLALVEQTRRLAKPLRIDLDPRREQTAAALAQAGSVQPSLAPTAAMIEGLKLSLQQARGPQKLAVARAFAEVARAGSISDAVPVLLRALETADAELSQPLALALARSGQADVLPALLAGIDREDLPLQPQLAALGVYFEVAQRHGRTPRGRAAWLAALPSAQRGALEPWLGAEGRAAARLVARLATATRKQRVEIVALLADVGSPRAVPALLALNLEEDAVLRRQVLHTLGAIGDVQAVPMLLRALRVADRATLREAALALWECADAVAVDALIRGLPRADRDTARTSLFALGGALRRMSDTHALQEPLARAALEVIAPRVQDPDREVAAAASAALGTWAPDQALSTLAAVLRSPVAARRIEALNAIAAIRDPEARPLLHYVLQNGSARETAAAALGFGEVGDQRDTPALLRTIARRHWPARGAAAFALARMAERGVLKPHAAGRELCALVSAREPHVRTNAIAALARLQAPPCEGLEPATLLQARAATSVRMAAARWLAASASAGVPGIDPRAATATLVDCAQRDPDSGVREACASPALPTQYDRLVVAAIDEQNGTPLADTVVGIQLSSGMMFLGITDALGHVQLPAAPAGPMSLENPALVPLDR